MVRVKEVTFSENDLVNLYYSCPVFKKYYQYNLWSGSFIEYNTIKECKFYMQRYTSLWIHTYLLQRFSFSFILVLYKRPYFIKFIESSFFRYVDSTFLLAFYNNDFFFCTTPPYRIKVFVQCYFQTYVRKRLLNDLFVFLNIVIDETMFRYSTKDVTIRLNYTQNFRGRVKLYINNKVPWALNTNQIYEYYFKPDTQNYLKFIGTNNKDIEKLIEVDELLEYVNLGLYRNVSILSYKPSSNYFLISKNLVKTFEIFFKSFNKCFFKFNVKSYSKTNQFL